MNLDLLLPALLLAGTAPVVAVPSQDDGGVVQALVDAATSGATVELPAGRYDGPVHIDKSLTLRALGHVVLDGGGEGDVVTVSAPDVVLEGFEIRGTGTSLDRENAAIVVTAPRVTIRDCVLDDVLFGLYLKGAEESLISGNTIRSKPLAQPRRGDAIRLWQSPRSVIEDNVVTGSRDTIMWFSDDVLLRRNRVTEGRYGMHFMYSSRNVLEDNVLSDNSVGAFLMYSEDLTMRRNVLARNDGVSGFGIGLKDMDGLIAEDNLIIDNRVGLHLDNSPSIPGVSHLIARNVIAYNDVGIGFLPNVKGNTFTENSFIENVEQVAVLGAGVLRGNEFSVDGRGNFWSDYRGFDIDRDGVGDIEYRADALFENLIDRDPRTRLFLFSPAQHAIAMAARAFPIVAPRPKIVDPNPLTAALPTRATAAADRVGGGGVRAALLLLGAALACVLPAVLGANWSGASGSSHTNPGQGPSS